MEQHNGGRVISNSAWGAIGLILLAGLVVAAFFLSSMIEHM